jgi:hypothetical protein
LLQVACEQLTSTKGHHQNIDHLRNDNIACHRRWFDRATNDDAMTKKEKEGDLSHERETGTRRGINSR